MNWPSFVEKLLQLLLAAINITITIHFLLQNIKCEGITFDGSNAVLT
jgi:hypothetical protein